MKIGVSRQRGWNHTACLLLLGVCLAGCASPAAVESTPSAAPRAHTINRALPAYPIEQQSTAVNHSDRQGSLWVDGGALSEMFMNDKARRVGDIVTIQIVESSSAANNASTDTERETSLSLGLKSFFGLENSYKSDSSFFNPFGTVTSDYASEFEGSGTTKRSGKLNAFITARVIHILPNGNFIIEGNREVRINNENQIITLTGMVRPRDISSRNIIQSTFIADARISYSGSGVLNEQQRPGWLARIFDSFWPF